MKRLITEWVAIVVAVLAFLLSIHIESSHKDTDSEHRLTALEVHQDGTEKRLDSIDHKLDHLIESMLGEKPKP